MTFSTVRGSKWLRLAASVLNSMPSPVDVVGVLACLWVVYSSGVAS